MYIKRKGLLFLPSFGLLPSGSGGGGAAGGGAGGAVI